MDTNEFFIEGYSFPQSLPKEELYELIREGPKEAREKLITHNLRLVLYLVSNHFNTVLYNKQDLFSIGTIGLIKAIDTYDISKGFEFSTYASRCISNEILMFLRKLKKEENVVSLNSSMNDNNNKDDSETKLEDILFDDIDLVKEYEKMETIIYMSELLD